MLPLLLAVGRAQHRAKSRYVAAVRLITMQPGSWRSPGGAGRAVGMGRENTAPLTGLGVLEAVQGYCVEVAMIGCVLSQHCGALCRKRVYERHGGAISRQTERQKSNSWTARGGQTLSSKYRG